MRAGKGILYIRAVWPGDADKIERLVALVAVSLEVERVDGAVSNFRNSTGLLQCFVARRVIITPCPRLFHVIDHILIGIEVKREPICAVAKCQREGVHAAFPVHDARFLGSAFGDQQITPIARFSDGVFIQFPFTPEIIPVMPCRWHGGFDTPALFARMGNMFADTVTPCMIVVQGEDDGRVEPSFTQHDEESFRIVAATDRGDCHVPGVNK